MKLHHMGASSCFLPFPCSPPFVSLFFFFTMTLSPFFFFLGVDTGTKGPEPAIIEEAKGLAPSVQTSEA